MRAALTLTLDLAGAGGAVYGAWLVYPPAAWILGGLILMAFGHMLERSADAPDSEVLH